MEIKINPKFKKRVEGMFGRYQFQVGILEDGPHMEARRGERGKGGQDVLSTYAGGPVRKKSRTESGLSIADVSEELRERTGINYLTEPFKSPKNEEILKFTNAYMKLVFSRFGKSNERRAVNLLQAIVRNPMLRGDYGSNSTVTKKIKGFDRFMMDTAQLFKAIKARVTTGRGR